MMLIDDDGSQLEYRWDPIEQTFVEKSDGDYDHFTAASELSTQLFIMQRKEAADYIDDEAPMLDSFVDSNQLLEIMDWQETAQGYGFWEEIYHELMSYGWEDPIHPALGENK